MEPQLFEDGTYGFALTDESLEYTAAVEAVVLMMTDDDYYIELGLSANIYCDWETGIFVDNFDGYWFSLPDGQMLAVYIVDECYGYDIYTSPVIINDEVTNLRIIHNYENDVIIIDGAWDGIDENGMAAKTVYELQEGDSITPLYFAYAFDSDEETFYYGDEYIFDGEPEIYFDQKQNVYIYGATGFGKTELIRQYFKNGKYIYILCRQNSCDLSQIPEKCIHTATVVIDNVNAIESSELRNSILSLCSRKDLWMIIVGRSKMPSWLFNTFITKDMALITEDDIALSEEGIDRYMRSEGIILTEKELQFQKKCNEGSFYGIKYTAARLLAGDRISSELYDKNSIMFQNYAINNIISEINTEVSDFLMKVSIVDDFSEQLAITLTGNTAVLGLIERAKDAGNFIDEKNGIYTIRHQFLCALRKKASIEFSERELHQYAILAGGYYESHNDDDKALELYAKYNESDRIRELLIRNSRKNPESGYYIEMRKYYLMLSEEDILSNVYLMSAMSMLCSMLMDFEKSEYWYNKLSEYRNKVKGSMYREATCQIVYLDISLPHRGSINILELIKACYALLTDKSIPFPEFSVTSNLPSLMNGGKDFCDWSRHDRELASTVGKLVCTFLGKYGKGLVNAALAESFYEKGGDPYEIMSLVSKAKLEAEAGGKTELCFAATGTLIRQYIGMGDTDNAKALLSSFEKTAKQEGLRRLYPSIEAMKCHIALIEGDMRTAADWMNTAPDENEHFIAFERFHYLTKIRCYIAQENYSSAYTLIESMKYYAEHCDRKYISMELGILTAVLRYRTGSKWQDDFIETLEKICTYEFIPIISHEGAAVYELINKCADSCAENKNIDNKWFERVRNETGKMARRYPLYLKTTTKIVPELQPMDIRILTCLADGLSVQKTADNLNINYETLRSRIKEIYRKLGAKNKTEAVMIAREMKLI